MEQTKLSSVVALIHQGGVIAYPTEAVFGLGCDPDNKDAVFKLLSIKQRPVEKGLILISDDFEKLKPYLDLSSVTDIQLSRVLETWPGPFSWVFPKSDCCPEWVSGQFNTVAVRVTAHERVRELIAAVGKPLTSTSANLSGEPAITDEEVLKMQMTNVVDCIVPGKLGNSRQPSVITDVITGKTFRS